MKLFYHGPASVNRQIKTQSVPAMQVIGAFTCHDQLGRGKARLLALKNWHSAGFQLGDKPGNLDCRLRKESRPMLQ